MAAPRLFVSDSRCGLTALFPSPGRMWSLGALLLVVTGWLPSTATAQDKANWTSVKVPDVWKNPPAGEENLSWYRGFVQPPANWQGEDLELFVEPVDAAHEVWFNGKKVGQAGEFPPFFRSGLGGEGPVLHRG